MSAARPISIRLDERKRETLVRLLLEHRFQKEIMELVRRRAALAMQFYNDGLGKKKLKLIESLPENWLPTENSIKIVFGTNEFTELYFNGDFYCGSSLRGVIAKTDLPKKWLPIPQEYRQKPFRVYEANEPLGIKFFQLEQDQKELEARVTDASALARTYIWKTNTTAALKEAWPEMTPFCANLEKTIPFSLPAIPTGDLNKAFNLPVRNKAA